MHNIEEIYHNTFKTFVESAPILCLAADSSFITFYVNPFYQKIHNTTLEEAKGKHIKDIIGEEGFNDNLEYYNRTLKGETVVRNGSFLKLDGSTHHYKSIYSPIFNDEEIVGITGVVLDTTSEVEMKKLIENKQRYIDETVELYRGYFEVNLIGMASTSLEKGWLHINDKLCNMLEYSEEELFNLTWEELTYPEDLDKDLELWNSVLDGEIDSYTLDKRFITKSGSILYTKLFLKCIRNNDKTINHFIAFLENITEQKKQYDLYKQQVKENKILTETTKDGLWVVGEEGKLLDVNTAYCEMSGYSKEELLAMRIPELEAIESEEETRAHIEKIMHNGSDTFDTVHRKKNGETFDVNITTTYINLDGIKLFTSIRDITESKEHSKQIEQLAYFDKLTGLANRTLLSDRIEHAIKHSNRNKRDFAICMVDLDGFKEVNDTFGHDAGDCILQEAAKRMRKEIREDDTVARLGGDEFVLILTDIENNDACALALQRVLDSLSKPYMNNNQQITSITASIGVSIYPNDKVHSDALLRHADIAMYKSKNSGKNKFTFFDITSENRVQETSKILNRLKNAINTGQFTLYYQPKYEPASSVIAEVEALVRWNHPTMGILSPAEFLPIIENDDELSLLLDQWVVNEAFKQLKLWFEQNIELKVCINVSPKQFKGDLFQDWFCAFIASEQVPKDHLKFVEFEILETSVMDNMTKSNEFIKSLQEHGISLALDDFGTGYSSLTHLKELQVNTIKIDQLFVREMFENDASMTIVKAVIALSKAFNLSVTAEGAETMKHVDTLIEMGCDEIQGYAISHPLPVSDIVEFINSFKFKQNEKNT